MSAAEARLKIGTRGSPLALWQARWVAAELQKAHPGIQCELVTIRTLAEKFPERGVAEIGVGIFTRELDEALLAGRIDLAVHSLKDVPSELPAGITIAAVPPRESPLDAFLTARGAEKRRLDALPRGARIGTGSPRRKAQILHRRPDLEVVPLRGNVATRLRKVEELGLAGTILAHAGLRRLEEESAIAELLDPEVIVPAVSQGALGVAARDDGGIALHRAAALDHAESRIRVTAERAFLRQLRGGCQVPAGALATLEGSSAGPRLRLLGVVASPDGTSLIRGEASGGADAAERIGVELAQDLLGRGGAAILGTLRPQ